MIEKNERFELRVDPDFFIEVDAWRKAQPDLISRSEAIRKLVKLGSQEAAAALRISAQNFQMMRFQILSEGRAAPNSLSPSYVFAWDAGVFPLFSAADWHLPFADKFDVTESMMEEFLDRLDKDWDAEKVPSFYQLEDRHGARKAGTPWNRVKLLHACRYTFLDNRFDEKFWQAILAPADHPVEAKSIVQPANHSEVFFG